MGGGGGMDKIDCIRTAHVQRHNTPQNSGTHSFSKKLTIVGAKMALSVDNLKKVPVSFKVLTGQLYRHIYEHCNGPHTNKLRTQKQNSYHYRDAVVTESGGLHTDFATRYVCNSDFLYINIY